MPPWPNADRLDINMSSHPSDQETKSKKDKEFSADEGMRVLSYLLAGVLFYGGLGWGADALWHTGWGLPIGLVIGLATSVYLIIIRYGS